MKNKIFILLLFIAVSESFGQFYFGAGIGTHALQSSNVAAQNSNANGFIVKAGFVKMVSKKFGIGVGAEFVQYNQDVSNGNIFNSNTFLVDDTNSAFEYRIKTTGYVEHQRLNAIQIPLFLQFKTRVNVGTNFYARAGAKYMLPQTFTTKATANQVGGSGYYPDFNLLITDLPSRGFGSAPDYNASGSYQTKNVLLANIEFGFSFKVAKKSTIYAGFYLDKATNSLIKNDSNQSFIGYNPNATSNRPLNGIYTSNKNIEVKPNNVGLSLSYSFE